MSLGGFLCPSVCVCVPCLAIATHWHSNSCCACVRFYIKFLLDRYSMFWFNVASHCGGPGFDTLNSSMTLQLFLGLCVCAFFLHLATSQDTSIVTHSLIRVKCSPAPAALFVSVRGCVCVFHWHSNSCHPCVRFYIKFWFYWYSIFCFNVASHCVGPGFDTSNSSMTSKLSFCLCVCYHLHSASSLCYFPEQTFLLFYLTHSLFRVKCSPALQRYLCVFVCSTSGRCSHPRCHSNSCCSCVRFYMKFLLDWYSMF